MSLTMIRIAHIADVHWRGLSRHAEYVEIFTEFASQVKSNGVQHVFVGGDIFHTKTSGLSPEYIEMMSWWLETLAKSAELHLTLGNHDGNLVNLSRQDAVTPIVKALGNQKIHLYKQSGVYEFAPGYTWCIYSLFDEEGWQNVKPVPGKVNIACYHGPVWGARTESDWLIEDGLTIDFFKDYDFVMLGDIHRTQFLGFRDVELVIDEQDLVRYPGAEVIEEID
jgi:hypothetical protein